MLVPKLRFKEFNDEWNKIKLSNIVTELNEKTNDTNNYPLWSLTLEDGVTPKTERYERGFLVKKEDNFKIVHYNNFVYNPMNLRLGAIAYHKEKIDISVSGYYNIFKIKNNCTIGFWDNYFKCPMMIKRYNNIATGSLVEKKRVHYSQFIELSVPVPSEEEQIKISNLLVLLNKKIELQQRKIEVLKMYKRGLIHKIFDYNKNISNQYKISECINIFDRKTTKNNEFTILSSTKDGIKIQDDYFNRQTASENNIGYKIIPRNYITYRSMSDTGDFYFNIQNIIDIGIVSPAYPVFNTIDTIDINYFINYINFSSQFKNQILINKEGGTRFALSISKFSDLVIELPEYEIQLYYSRIISNTDKKIIVGENKLKNLDALKKSLLQQMFI